MFLRAERWKLQQAAEVKKLPVKVQVLSIYEHVEKEPPVPLVGEEITILKTEEDIFLRANPITEGKKEDVLLLLFE